MAEIINKYETIFVLDAALDEEKTNALTEKFKALIAENGTVESVDVWGKRKLAYPIDFKELERIYGITDGVIRTLTVRKEA